MGTKYVVRVGRDEQTFTDRRTAEEWFCSVWMHGLDWEFHKFENGNFVW